ncbi:MAG: ADP-ribosylation factor-like protein [Promethearchaeota archaeon]
MKDLKIIISGLDNAGKTSILTALDKRYDFQKEIIQLVPTIKVKYHHTNYLGRDVYIWDMGGQEKYRKTYEDKQDVYFDGVDLLIYVIDIQDSARFEAALEYLNRVLEIFELNNLSVPLMVAFHKLDPELRDDEDILRKVKDLTDKIFKLKELEMLFLQTSIYDIYSVVHLISSALSIFNEKHLELKKLFESYLKKINGKSLILFDQNGIIISEFFTHSLDINSYLELLNSITDQIIVLKKIQDKDHEHENNFTQISESLVSYLHKLKYNDDSLYVSVLVEKKEKETVQEKVSFFVNDLNRILEPFLS